MARIVTQALRNARFRQLHRLRGSLRSFAKNLRRFRRSFGLRHNESTSKHPHSKISSIFQAHQSQDQIARHCLRQSVHHWKVPGLDESH